jgi:hypothetical protein
MKMKGTAGFSPCQTFRWWLHRHWSDGPLVCFVMLNPSTATADQDDPTITRCINYAKAWGFGALSVRNLYPYRATKPAALKRAMKRIDVTGGHRGHTELRAAISADLIIAAWGMHATDAAAQRFIELSAPKPLWCLGTTKDGKPVHPLMQRGDLAPAPFVRCDGRDWRTYLGQFT